MEWDYEVGQQVYADVDSSYKLPDDAIFTVEERINDGDDMYVLHYPGNDQRYEAYGTMITAMSVAVER
jgi:hypothetical protein